jgi:DNA-binding winged helix-turn-helix (wHTH) protein/class 3 adenylate cyclase
MIFEFQDCRLDDETCELARQGEVVPLQPKVLDLLLYLLRHRDRVVSKDELLDQVWPGVAVGDAVLTRAINLARNALGDAGRDRAVIRTLPRKGYRFCAEVRCRAGEKGPARSAALLAADEAWAARDWQRTLDALDRAQAEAPLGAADLERRGWSLLWAAQFAEATHAFESAHAAYEDAGEARAAARVALQLTRDFSQRQQNALAAGWLQRATALLDSLPECEEHAMLEWIRGRAQSGAGRLDHALEHADRAIEIARRVGSRDVEALGLLDRGHCLLATGRIDEAISLHEEVTAVAMGGGLGVQATGTIYCSVIWGCRNRGDWERASQWTDHSIQWCGTARVAQFPGLCTLHRAEVLRHRGQLEEAEREVLRACDDLLVSMTFVAGDAFNELGEIRMRRGNLSGAREAFRRAIEFGMDPEPGLSRLRVEDGDVDGALKGLERALSDTRLNAQERQFLLLVGQIEAALAGGRRDLARAALERLENEPSLSSTAAHRADLEACRGRVALADGRTPEAVAALQEARRSWLGVGAPYEAARVQALLALALEAEGDASGARLVWESARDAFERVGAHLDAQRASRRLAQLASGGESAVQADRSLRTFVFTDIVGSTRLVEMMGDADWETLRRWHHRTLQASFTEFGGEVVGPHEGDGFFVAFADADAALDCGIAIQRALAAHREQHGFAPQVRIGAHTAESLRRGGDYAGIGVHVAARVAAAAAGSSVCVTTTTLERASRPRKTGPPRRLEVEGAREVVEVVDVDWH